MFSPSPPRSQTPQDTNRASETDTHSLGEKNSSQVRCARAHICDLFVRSSVESSPQKQWRGWGGTPRTSRWTGSGRGLGWVGCAARAPLPSHAVQGDTGSGQGEGSWEPGGGSVCWAVCGWERAWGPMCCFSGGLGWAGASAALPGPFWS